MVSAHVFILPYLCEVLEPRCCRELQLWGSVSVPPAKEAVDLKDLSVRKGEQFPKKL